MDEQRPKPLKPVFIDAKERLAEERKAEGLLSSAEIAVPSQRPPQRPLEASTALSSEAPLETIEEMAKRDFRVFLTLIWRFLLSVDPSPVQLDMAYWMQHGPARSITMAFRGFSKSWITGAYALWRIYVNPDEKVLVVSGNLSRSQATTNWCLMLILTMPLLKHMAPKRYMRSSSTMFDVGTCQPAQSASFMALGIGGQLPGWRASLIIGDDVETQNNSLTVVMRDKVREAVKEFESIIVPGGDIRYLGTPHDRDSLYLFLDRLRLKDGSKVYQTRIWPCFFPTIEQREGYGQNLAPWIIKQEVKRGPSIVGHSVMPNRFTDDDLERRRAAMGNSEFQLQFMLDLKGLDGSTPLKLADLTVMDLDPKKGPDSVIWGTTNLMRDLQVMGTEGDHYYGPVMEGSESVQYVPWQKVIGWVDPSGRGLDETSLVILALLNGKAFWLHLWANTKGYEPATLKTIADACVRFSVQDLHIEVNYGDGMFATLLRPVLAAAWAKANATAEKLAREKGRVLGSEEYGGTSIIEAKAGGVFKEARILNVMEPVTQQHRLVVSRAVIQWDLDSLSGIEGEETRHYYAWGHQYTHLAKVKDCLTHDDRIEALSGAVGVLALDLGIDPEEAALNSRAGRADDEIERLMAELYEAAGLSPFKNDLEYRMRSLRPSTRRS